jgi:hypothetical protein
MKGASDDWTEALPDHLASSLARVWHACPDQAQTQYEIICTHSQVGAIGKSQTLHAVVGSNSVPPGPCEKKRCRANCQERVKFKNPYACLENRLKRYVLANVFSNLEVQDWA